MFSRVEAHIIFILSPAIHDSRRLLSHLLMYLVAYITNNIDPDWTACSRMSTDNLS